MTTRKSRLIRSVRRQVLGRRVFLRGTAVGVGVTVGLPVLDIMLDGNGTKLAHGQDLPLRFGTYYWGGGITHSAWTPATTGTGWQPKLILQPLATAALKPYVTVVSGFNHPGSSPGHIPARGMALSSSHDMTVCQGECIGTYRSQNHPEPSLDALVAEKWAGRTRFDLLAVSVCQKGPYMNNSSWKRGGTTYNRHEPSPLALWNRVFQNFDPSGAPSGGLLQTTTAYEKSLLDAVLADANALKARVGIRDRQRLDSHLSGIRALELQLQARQGMPTAPASGCTKPAAPATQNFGDGSTREEKEAKAILHAKVLSTALACDLTRIFSYEWSATQNQSYYWEVGPEGEQEHHEWNHNANQTTPYATSIQLVMKGLAHLAEELRQKPEGGGNVLDRTLIFATSEHANAAAHDWNDHPILFVGKAGGRIAAGQHFRAGTDKSAPKVMLTAVKAVEPSITRLGQANSDGNRLAIQTIPELEA